MIDFLTESNTRVSFMRQSCLCLTVLSITHSPSYIRFTLINNDIYDEWNAHYLGRDRSSSNSYCWVVRNSKGKESSVRPPSFLIHLSIFPFLPETPDLIYCPAIVYSRLPRLTQELKRCSHANTQTHSNMYHPHSYLYMVNVGNHLSCSITSFDGYVYFLNLIIVGESFFLPQCAWWLDEMK